MGVIQDTSLDHTDKRREAFAKIKNLLRKAAVGSKDASAEVIGAALSIIAAGGARGYFEYAGYH